MTPQEAHQAADKEFYEALNEPFPVELIHEDFELESNWMAMHESVKSLNTSWDVLRKLLNPISEPLTISEMGAALNAITNRSFKETGYSDVAEYIRIQDFAFQMASEWNKIVTTTRERITQKYATRLQLTKGLN